MATRGIVGDEEGKEIALQMIEDSQDESGKLMFVELKHRKCEASCCSSDLGWIENSNMGRKDGCRIKYTLVEGMENFC